MTLISIMLHLTKISKLCHSPRRNLCILLVACAVSGTFAARGPHLHRPRRMRPRKMPHYHSFIQNDKTTTVEAMYDTQVSVTPFFDHSIFRLHS